jgi:hypothetical protein
MKIKIIICLAVCLLIEQSSASLLADYIFEDNLSGSINGALDIEYLGDSAVYENGTVDGIAVRAIQIELDSGLNLDLSQWAICDDYTLVLHGYIDDVMGYKKLIDFRNLAGDGGLYNREGFLSFVPGNEAPNNRMVANEYFQLVVTRDSSHLVTTYINGEVQFSFTDNSLSTRMCSTNQFNFFVDDLSTNVESPRGAVARVTIYDHALSSEEVENMEVLDIIFADVFEAELP